jgi:hypothetical protein
MIWRIFQTDPLLSRQCREHLNAQMQNQELHFSRNFAAELDICCGEQLAYT